MKLFCISFLYSVTLYFCFFSEGASRKILVVLNTENQVDKSPTAEALAWGQTSDERERYLRASKEGKSPQKLDSKISKREKGKSIHKGQSYSYHKDHSYSYKGRITMTENQVKESADTSYTTVALPWEKTPSNRVLKGDKPPSKEGSSTGSKGRVGSKNKQTPGQSYSYHKGHSYSYIRRVAKTESHQVQETARSSIKTTANAAWGRLLSEREILKRTLKGEKQLKQVVSKKSKESRVKKLGHRGRNSFSY